MDRAKLKPIINFFIAQIILITIYIKNQKRRIMKPLKLITLLTVALTLTYCSNAGNTETEITTEVIEVKPVELSLYDRLGGEEGISSIVDDIINAHMNNPVISAKFAHLKDDPEHLKVFQQHVKDFLGAGTGGTEKYTGQDMPTAHKGLQTTSTEFLSTIDDIMGVLSQHNIDDQTKKDMLYILYSFKGQVIGL
jgi:hemoglobin